MVKISIVVLAVLISAAACARPQGVVPQPGEELLRGTVAYRERIALPPDAVLEVFVTDESALTSASPVVGEVAFLTDGQQVPLPFAVRYRTAMIDRGHTYGVRAIIRANGEILFSSPEAVPVITQGNPTEVTLMLVTPAR